jgi:hypothetical protein
MNRIKGGTSIRLVSCVVSLVASLVVAASPTHASPGPGQDGRPERPSTPDLIERARDRGEISRYRADLYLAYALGRPDKLPRAFASDTPWRGTLPLLELHERIDKMPPGPRKQSLRSSIEPTAAGTKCSNSNAPSNATTSAHFLIHYPASIGEDLTLSDYVQSLETAWTKETTTFGWPGPPLHPNAGGKYHVIIKDLAQGLYGFVSPSGTYAGNRGNNPNTSWTENDAYASCMALNSDYSEFESGPQAALDSTTAHEFNHSIQFGLGALTGANRPDSIFVEGGATWMEDEVFDGADDNYHYLWPQFDEDMGNYLSSPYPYWITFRGLTERYGTGTAGAGEQVMQDFWEEVSKETNLDLDAMDVALQNRGTDLADAYHAYAVAVRSSKPCGGGYVLPYCFEEGAGYVADAGLPPTSGNGGTISTLAGSFSGSVPANYALNWVALPTGLSAYEITMENTSPGGEMRTTIACDTGTSLQLTPMPSVVGAHESTSLDSLDPTGCVRVTAVITNQEQTGADAITSIQRSYTIRTSAVEDTTPPSTPSLSPLPHFKAATTIGLDWSASSDGESGIDHYDLEQRIAPPGQPFGAWQDAGSFPNTSHDINGEPGHTHCFRVSATNGADLTSDPSDPRCVALPLDDRDLTGTNGWELGTGSKHYLGTFKRSSLRGQRLSEEIAAKRLALVATRCPGCGTVKVLLEGELLRKISLDRDTRMRRRVIPIATFSEPRSGTLTIRITSEGKPVVIDGLGVSPL